jgi:hypothetical protein
MKGDYTERLAQNCMSRMPPIIVIAVATKVGVNSACRLNSKLKGFSEDARMINDGLKPVAEPFYVHRCT